MTVRLDSLLVRAARAVRLLPAVTPVGAVLERERLARAVGAGRPAHPRWTYVPAARNDLATVFAAARAELSQVRRSALKLVYADRLTELEDENAIVGCVGSAEFGHRAALRFSPTSSTVAVRAEELARAWLSASASVPGASGTAGDATPPAAPGSRDGRARESESPALWSDDPHPASLLSRMRAEVSRQRLPFRVVVDPTLGSLAATGERTIFVASKRLTRAEDVERTVLHEIEGHVFPRVRAAKLNHALFAIGTARGTDEQEGLALLIEQRNGHFGASRTRELAARHMAVLWMHDGASFADVAHRLHADYGLPPEEAVRVAERAFRGGDGVGRGLGRERVYLESLVAVERHLRDAPDDERVLASGQVATAYASALRPFVPRFPD